MKICPEIQTYASKIDVREVQRGPGADHWSRGLGNETPRSCISSLFLSILEGIVEV